METFRTVAAVVGFCVSLVTLIGLFVSIGQYKQKITDEEDDISDLNKKCDELEKKVETKFVELKKKGDADSRMLQDFQRTFAEFSGELRASMKFIQEDLKDIKKDMKETRNA